MADVIKAGWDDYRNQLNLHPLRTKAVTSGVIAGTSDVIAQVVSGAPSIRWRRTALMAIFGVVWSGPSAHFFHTFLDKWFRGKRDTLTAIRKVIIDQLTYGPVCNNLFMMYITMVVEGRSWAFAREKWRRDYPGVQMNGWKLWPLAGLINYKFVPLQLRVLFVNMVAFCWSIFLILRTQRGLAAATLKSS
eukprot:jgi/Mesvir1/25450/Mv01721-RA.1